MCEHIYIYIYSFVLHGDLACHENRSFYFLLVNELKVSDRCSMELFHDINNVMEGPHKGCVCMSECIYRSHHGRWSLVFPGVVHLLVPLGR